MKNIFHCTIEILSPVHIGCDEFYEPTGFVIDESNGQLIHFDPVLFLSTLEPEERDRFSAICQEGTVSSIQKIYQFFRGKPAQGRRVHLCDGFLDHYKKTLNLPDNRFQKELNNFSIQRTAFRLVDGRPYLPGSSVKGALRTGYLNEVCQGRKTGKSGKDIEKHLLNYSRIDDDPFGKVKVSDFQPVGDTQTLIVYAVNKKKKISDKEARGLSQMLEVIQPGALFQGIIEVADASVSPHIKQPVQLDQLLSGAVGFYLKEFQREAGELAAIQIPPPVVKTIDQGGNALPLRIGRHSGAESVTIDGNREIRIMLGGRDFTCKDHATTLWLAANQPKAASASSLQPFGWISISGLSLEQQRVLTSKEKAYIREQNREAEEKLALQEEQRKAEEKGKREAEERKAAIERQEQEQKELEQKLEQMGPEERFAAEFDRDLLAEDQINAMYNRIDEIEDAFKIQIASRLAAYYQKNNMWEKKDAPSKNQWKKIRDRKNKLEEILGNQ
ncbi:type III-A CRISPR-associated RAMP protein Csm5 [Desulfotignum phosphitoxidans]|uniref:CRISPR system Cms protein Csm5 n=1 Tax=Desulfotignum phosphitoxidans DSM 13687 TaxID=1286635 RepID=S0G6R2_9BACT|nr:type III-A CRISPR-associated RAMP protein Csm5 [Desulfotignum phosphitoxidans]EMS80216.1 CRISPR subtype III-A/MTUBE-associated RAMP protein Csm5 [Desulfotignum phosphitoxidans DSM 13687]